MYHKSCISVFVKLLMSKEKQVIVEYEQLKTGFSYSDSDIDLVGQEDLYDNRESCCIYPCIIQ